MIPKLDEGAAFAGVSLAVLATLNIYKDTAPSLAKIRRSEPGDYEARQLILDADVLGLIVVLALGGGGAMLIRKVYPLILAGAALLLMSAYYRSVLRSPYHGRHDAGLDDL